MKPEHRNPRGMKFRAASLVWSQISSSDMLEPPCCKHGVVHISSCYTEFPLHAFCYMRYKKRWKKDAVVRERHRVLFPERIKKLVMFVTLCLCVLVMFCPSALCRSVEQCFHMCDRMVIYFFIAASYTPW